MSMMSEFKSFAMRGNVMDMAVGIIVGAAFTAIVTSLVGDLIQPFIGLFTGGIDFSNLFYTIGGGDYATLEAAREAGGATFAYGAFFMAVINFLIIAFVVFMLVRTVNKLKDAATREEVAAAESPVKDPSPTELEILIEIRDSLKAQN